MAEKLQPDCDGRFPCEFGCEPAPGEDPNKYRYKSPGGRGQHYYRRHSYASSNPKTINRRKRKIDGAAVRRSTVAPTTEFPAYDASRDRRGPLTPGELNRLRSRLRYLVTGALAIEFDRSPEALLDAIAKLAKERLSLPKQGTRVNPIDSLVLSSFSAHAL